MPRPRPAAVALAALLLVAGGCEAIAPAAAVVNGERISEAELQEEMDRARDDPTVRELIRQQGPEARGLLRRNVLSEFIRVVLERQEARRMGIRITPQRVQGFLRRLRAQLGGEAALRQALQQQGLSLARLRVQVERLLYEQELQRRVTAHLTVDEAQVQRFYEQNRSQFTEVHLARVVVRSQQEAQRVVDQVNQGSDFGAIARQQSIDAQTAARGGDLGYLPQARLPQQLAAQLEGVPIGGLAGPVPEGQAFAVYQVLDRRPKPLAEVREEIVDQLLAQDRQRVFSDWLAERLRRARVVVNPKYGRFDRRSLAVVAAPPRLPE